LKQKELNSSILSSMTRISSAGTSTRRDMEDVSVSLKTLIKEIEMLKQGMEVFKIK